MANKITVTTGDEAESADYYVCGRAATTKQLFDDDLYDFCCKCGEKVRYRPHGPTVPKKICMECVMPELDEEAKKGELGILTTEKTMEEVRNFFRRN
jgi:hypothetical protein